MNMIEKTEGNILRSAKGFFSDGELGLLKQFKDRYSGIPVQLCAFHKYSRIGQIVSFVRSDSIGKEIKQRVENVIFAKTKQNAFSALVNLKRYAGEHQENAKLRKVIGVINRNFELLLTHFDHPEMSPYNNVLEGFNHIIKRRIRLMKGFKEEENIDRWLKLLLIDYRFHTIKESKFSNRNRKSPLELSDVKLEKYHNWMTLIRRKYSDRS